jgi:gliding motility-associated protein GldM
MALPREPRQKMINMMYLVLTALLAINVSAEILNAFKTVNHSINRSNELIDNKNNDDIKTFVAAEKTQNKDSVLKFENYARAAKLIGENASVFIDSLAKQIKMASHGSQVPVDPEYPDGIKFADDNMDGPTRVMDNQKQGKRLLDSLIAWKLAFEQLAPHNFTSAQRDTFNKSLALKIDTPKVENSGNRGWVGAHFRMVPAIAAITILDKFKNDIKSTANSIIESNLAQINATDVHLDNFEPYVSANSLYLMNGQQFSATVGVGAFSSAINPTITVDGQPLAVSQGKGIYTTTASGSGSHTVRIHISMKKPDGSTIEKDEDVTYNVGSSTLAVSSELTKVLFRGIDNPISVSGGGVGAEGLSVTGDNGEPHSKGNGKYIINPGDGNYEKISVTAHRPDGSSANLGSETFQVKDLPNPVAYIGTSGGGRMRSAEFKANLGLRAVLENFDFLSGVNFQVTGFTIYAVGGDQIPQILQGTSTSYSFAQVQNIISKCRPGTMVSIEDIHAVGPDHKTRKLRGISFTLY